jgi:hypothetical protein
VQPADEPVPPQPSPLSPVESVKTAPPPPMLNGIKPHTPPPLEPSTGLQPGPRPPRQSNGASWLGDGEDRLTAVFRPESSDAWKAQLRAANERALAAEAAAPEGDSQLGTLGVETGSEGGSPDPDADDDEADRRSTTSSSSSAGKSANGESRSEPRSWRARKTIRKCVAFRLCRVCCLLSRVQSPRRGPMSRL